DGTSDQITLLGLEHRGSRIVHRGSHCGIQPRIARHFPARGTRYRTRESEMDVRQVSGPEPGYLRLLRRAHGTRRGADGLDLVVVPCPQLALQRRWRPRAKLCRALHEPGPVLAERPAGWNGRGHVKAR